MKIRILFLSFALVAISHVKAQTVIYTENWGTGGAGWTMNVVTGIEGTDPNFFLVADNEGGGIPPDLGAPGSCGVANNGNNTLHVTSVFNPAGGAAYDTGGLCGFLFCPQANRRTESPIINCTGQSTITLNFTYIEGGQGALDDATVWYNDGTGFVLLDNPPKTLTGCGGQGLWVTRSIALPASADNNPLVQIAFGWINNDDGAGADPSFAVDDITLTVPAAALPVVTITPSPNDSICQNTTLTLNGSATNGPITAWAWTVSPGAGVAFLPDTAAQNPTVTFTTPGTYTFTLQATNGSGNGTNTQVITVLPASVPSVTITASPLNPVCSGTAINFTATPTNGGTTPAFQWQVNGLNVGANSPNFSSSTLNNNDVITVTVTSSDSCASPATAADSYTVLINPSVVPSVTIAASSTVICGGTNISFTATPTNGGVTPAYQWQVNGLNVGANSPNFSSTTLNNGDAISVILTSNDPCPTPATANSNTITVLVTPIAPASVTITATPNNPVCIGTTVNFTATPTNGGTTPAFQWQVNGLNVGVNSPNFSSSTLNNGDVITVTVTSNDSCALPATGADSYTIVTTTSVVPTVTITADDSSVCAGTVINFTATPTNGGLTPAYQWQVNGLNVGANSPNFSSGALNNNDTVTVILTSSDACAVPTSDTSATIIVTITPIVVPSVVLSAAPVNPVCAGTTVSFTATPTNGGTAPVYQWQVNGVNVGVNSPNFSSSTLNNSDTVAVIMTSNELCTTVASDTDTYIMVVDPLLVPSVIVTPDPVSACTGDSIVFTATPTNGGTTPVFQWVVNGVNVGTNSTSFTLNPVAGGEQVFVILTSNAVCATPATVNSNTVTVSANPTPTLSIATATTTICPNLPDTLLATATAGSSFTWTPAGGLNTTSNDTVVANNGITGTYTYYVTATLNGCSRTDSVQITVANTFTTSAGPAITICSGDSANLSVTSGTTWTWTPAADLSCSNCQNPVATPASVTVSTTITYSVIADLAGCLDTVTQSVTVIPNASASFNTTVITQGLPQLIGFTNTSTNANTFYWTLGNGNTSVMQTPANQNYNVAGTYTVVLIAYGTNNCNDTISTLIFVNDSVGITVPNIFTPNGDEINDVWQPSVHGATEFECIIYNRYGILVYEFISGQDKWDGHTTAGSACVAGTYYYILKATDSNNKSYDLKGFIQLIR